MSDTPLAAAAAALGMPEDLTRRSAEARAAESGSSVDEILSAWAGGEAIAATSSVAPEQPPSVEESVEPPAEQPDAVPEIVIETLPSEVAPVAAAPVGDYQQDTAPRGALLLLFFMSCFLLFRLNLSSS